MGIPREAAINSKKFTNSNLLKRYKEQLFLSNLQQDVLIGTILGDGSFLLSRSERAARLQVCHSYSSKEYVYWKKKIFKDWVRSGPKYNRVNNSLLFRTLSHPDIFKYRQLFYKDNVKIIPENISTLLTSNLSLAVWFMDDGNGYLKNSAFRLSTYAFGFKGNKLLQNCLNKNFGLNVSLINEKKKGYQLYIPIRNGSASNFKKLILPYIIPSMRYKIESRSPVETESEDYLANSCKTRFS